MQIDNQEHLGANRLQVFMLSLCMGKFIEQVERLVKFHNLKRMSVYKTLHLIDGRVLCLQ